MSGAARLYHGTEAKCLPAIEAGGLQPRIRSKSKGNWSHTVDSNRKAVYLTDAYAWHFASIASDRKRNGLILEFDKSVLKPWRLCPDEDFLEHCSRRLPPGADNPNFAPTDWPMKKRLRYYRGLAEHNSALAEQSLSAMGTVAYYDTIPWDAVTRYVVIDWGKLDPSMFLRAVDSLVSPLNYRFLQDRHRAFTRWFFGDPVTAAEVTGNVGFRRWPDWVGKADEATAEAMKNREGLKVVTVKIPEALAG